MPTPVVNSVQSRPLIYGEVLFDTFPDGNEVLGGAAFNVAWHLRGFGLNPLLISRVGNDAHGQQVLESMRTWGMDERGMQTDGERPTGSVTVELDNGQPSFTILPLQAYDFIDRAAALRALEGEQFSLLYHGTLIARNSTSYEVLQDLRASTQLPAFVDINLRNPWWSGEIVEATLNGARWGKMNRDELGEIVNDPVLNAETTEDAARELCQRYGLEFLIITLGSDGACVISASETTCAPSPPIDNVVDTVGAGDAFSAVTLLGLAHHWPLSLVQQRALEFAGAVCQIPGAVSQNKELYTGHLARWKN